MKLVDLYRRKLDNQKLSLKEFEEGAVELRSRPSKLIVELTQNCNFKCVMCDQSQAQLHPQYARYDPGLNMDLDLFDRVSAELFLDAHFVDLRGFGESVIHPQWAEVVDRLENFPLIDWHLVTNLSLPRDEVWKKLIKNRFILGISFDGATAETFEKIRARSHFKTILHNLKVVTDAVKTTGYGHLYFIVVVQGDNVDEIPAIVELARDHGIKDVQLKAVRGEHHKVLGDWPKRAPASISRAVDVAIEAGVRLTVNDAILIHGIDPSKIKKAGAIAYPSPVLNFRPPEGSNEAEAISTMEKVRDLSRVSVYKKCFKPFHYTYVASDGRVGTCNHMLNPLIEVMGDLKTQSFAEIWNGGPYRFFRASLSRAMPFDFRCKWCFDHRLED